jgi:plasmid stabilization system protein ParE
MTRRLIVAPETRAEIAEASDWYDARSIDVGTAFLRAVDVTIDRIVDNPLQYQIVGRGRRRAPVGQFPYGLFYIVSDEAITVIGCLHARRHPKHWRSRT